MEPWITADPSIDEQLNPKMVWAQDRKAEAQQLALDATRMLSCTQERLDQYKSQRFFSRCWSTLTGKRHAAQQANQQDLHDMQKAAWRYINMLSERDLMTVDSIIAVKNNLLTLDIKEIETRRALENMTRRVLDRFHQLEERVDRLEQSDELNRYLNTIESKDYDELYPPIFRMLRVISDFCDIKNGGWEDHEIRCFQIALKRVRLPWKRSVSLRSFLHQFAKELDQAPVPEYTELVQIGANGSTVPTAFILESVSAPAFSSLYHALKVYENSSPFARYLESQGHLNVGRCDAIKGFLDTSAEKQGIDLEVKIPVRDLAVELLHSRRLTSELYQISNGNQVHATTPQIEILTKRPSPTTPPPDAAVQAEEVDGSVLESKQEFRQLPFHELREIVEHGNLDAQYELARRYEQGEGLAKDESRSLELIKQAAFAGHLNAVLWLADALAASNDIELSDKEAESWDILLSTSDFANDSRVLVWRALMSDSVDDRLNLLTQAIAAGNLTACFWMGHHYFELFEDTEKQEDAELALHYWSQGVGTKQSNSDPYCLKPLGELHMQGIVADRKPSTAVKYWQQSHALLKEKLALQGRLTHYERAIFGAVCNNLLDAFLSGSGVKKGIGHAIRLVSEEAELVPSICSAIKYAMLPNLQAYSGFIGDNPECWSAEQAWMLLEQCEEYSSEDTAEIQASQYLRAYFLQHGIGTKKDAESAYKIWKHDIVHDGRVGPYSTHWGFAAFLQATWLKHGLADGDPIEFAFTPEWPEDMGFWLATMFSSYRADIFGPEISFYKSDELVVKFDMREPAEIDFARGVSDQLIWNGVSVVKKFEIGVGTWLANFLRDVCQFCREHASDFDDSDD